MIPVSCATIEALAALLTQQSWLMATAESCTGGLVAAELTAVAGASKWFDHSVVSYSYDAKEHFLGVKALTLAVEGAVSASCVTEMVNGLLRHSAVDAGIAISGIAGPEGGTAEKPVGTVWFSFANKKAETVSVCRYFSGDRQAVRQQACAFAIDYFYHYLVKVVALHL